MIPRKRTFAQAIAGLEWTAHVKSLDLRKLITPPRDYWELVADCFPQAVGVRLGPYPRPSSWDVVREENYTKAAVGVPQSVAVSLLLDNAHITPVNKLFHTISRLKVPADHIYIGEIRGWIDKMRSTDFAIQMLLTHLQEVLRLGGVVALETWPEITQAMPDLRAPKGYPKEAARLRELGAMAASHERAELNRTLALLAMIPPDTPQVEYWIADGILDS